YTQHINGRIPTLGVGVDGDVAVELAHPRCSGSKKCGGGGGLGAACLAGTIDLGGLGKAGGTVAAKLDFRLPRATVYIEHVTFLDIGVAVSVTEAFASAKFRLACLNFNVIVPSITALTPDLIVGLVKPSPQPHS